MRGLQRADEQPFVPFILEDMLNPVIYHGNMVHHGNMVYHGNVFHNGNMIHNDSMIHHGYMLNQVIHHGNMEIERQVAITQLLQHENLKLRFQNEKLLNQTEKLQDENGELRDNINDLITCQICFEQFQSTGERVACKLDCPHIMCKKCAEEWLKTVRFYCRSKVREILLLLHIIFRNPRG